MVSSSSAGGMAATARSMRGRSTARSHGPYVGCRTCAPGEHPTPSSSRSVRPPPRPRHNITLRNFRTHGQLSAAQGSRTNCLSTVSQLRHPFNITFYSPRLCSLMVRRWSLTAHFLILYCPHAPRTQYRTARKKVRIVKILGLARRDGKWSLNDGEIQNPSGRAAI
jgi:hypothetical protein